MAGTSLWVPVYRSAKVDEAFMTPVREAIRNEHKMNFGYRDEHGVESERVVWPFALAFFDGRRIVAAWCELRSAIRHFRVDRIAAAESAGQRYPARRSDLLTRWRRELSIEEDY